MLPGERYRKFGIRLACDRLAYTPFREYRRIVFYNNDVTIFAIDHLRSHTELELISGDGAIVYGICVGDRVARCECSHHSDYTDVFAKVFHDDIFNNLELQIT
jgi:hypothetical protein